jgi:hypothetical protein
MIWKMICGMGFLFLAWAIFSPDSVERILLQQRQHAEAPISIEPSAIEQTAAINVTLHPYDVLKDPFKFQNNLMVFDVISRPSFYDMHFYQYVDGIVDVRRHLSATGLQFRKMLSEGAALYDVEGVDPSFPVNLGQILVTGSNDELRIDRFWQVEPLGTVQSTNYFGAAPDVPVIKFWGYANQEKPISMAP